MPNTAQDKPMTAEWMLEKEPSEEGVIHEADCGCVFIHDEGARWWERCTAHDNDLCAFHEDNDEYCCFTATLVQSATAAAHAKAEGKK